jgi:hypothetical protein
MGTRNGRPAQATALPGHPGSASRQRDDRVDGVRGPPDEVLTFPRLRRLELDELLSQLVERAQEVMGTQGRLRGLLRANQLIAQDLGLPTVLRHVAEAARSWSAPATPRWGDRPESGGLSQFVHVGMPAEVAAAIGNLPQGKGLLGALIDDPAPIRLATLSADTRSCGFPPGHPPMQGFLGVPIRIGEVVFGNLYLAESTRGGFSAEDEQLAQALGEEGVEGPLHISVVGNGMQALEGEQQLHPEKATIHGRPATHWSSSPPAAASSPTRTWSPLFSPPTHRTDRTRRVCVCGSRSASAART